MQKVLLFGGTGNLGKKIARELKQNGYDFTAVVRNEKKAGALKLFTDKFLILNVTSPIALVNICNGFDIVISSLGKSVSPNDKSKPSFHEVDLVANSNILAQAIKSGIQKFVYISALHSENYTHLEYFRVHYAFSEKLKQSGIDFSIIKPPAIFSSFLDLVDMAKKGRLLNLGKGDKLTNPIYEGDLAKICVDSIIKSNATIEAGGKEIFSRKEINEIIQKMVAPNKKVRSIPLSLMKMMLPAIKLIDKNSFDKFAFFVEVVQHNTIAPQVGEKRLEEYIKENILV